MHVLARLLINAAALWAATRLVSGISYTGDGVSLFGVALVFGVLNVLIKPILMFLTFPFVILTLGLFTLVINAVMLIITARASDALGLGFAVQDFPSAFMGALVVSIVSFGLSMFVSDGDGEKNKDRRLRA
jgi:putative membrane protein